MTDTDDDTDDDTDVSPLMGKRESENISFLVCVEDYLSGKGSNKASFGQLLRRRDSCG